MFVKPRLKSEQLVAIGFFALFAPSFVACLPNIRIQVNNENLQSPPYLLEAIKHVEASENSSMVRNVSTENRQQSTAVPTRNYTLHANESAAPSEIVEENNGAANNNNDENEPHSFNVVKEETIEEILDLDPESVLKLSPESLMTGISPSDFSRISTDNEASETANNQPGYSNPEGNDNSNKQTGELLTLKKHDMNVNPRKPQLPVANSHLKRPAEKLEADSSGSSSDGDTQGDAVPMKSGGAKSLISPSVAVEDSPPPAGSVAHESLKKKAFQPLPDTLEPGQVINGFNNNSAVPATVNREYGHTTRTRITLGGGYVRDRLPPLVNPASSEYSDDRPEKPVVPLEKPQLNPPSGPSEATQVVEIPEKIILPATVWRLTASVQQPANKGNNNSNVVMGKLDSRCPKRGVMTFDHATACDKYFYCEEGFIIEQTCPNGLMYGTRDMVVDYCVHRWKVNCEDKSLPNPISSPGCRWQYGIFNVQGSPKCSPDFYECTAGKFEVKRCAIEGQVYDDRTKGCQFAETVGCVSEALSDFKCPPDDQGNTYWPFPRYFLNERSLIHCINDKPEIVRCTENERVDPEHLHCVPLSKLSQANAELGERKARERKKSSQ